MLTSKSCVFKLHCFKFHLPVSLILIPALVARLLYQIKMIHDYCSVSCRIMLKNQQAPISLALSFLSFCVHIAQPIFINTITKTKRGAVIKAILIVSYVMERMNICLISFGIQTERPINFISFHMMVQFVSVSPQLHSLTKSIASKAEGGGGT